MEKKWKDKRKRGEKGIRKCFGKEREGRKQNKRKVTQ